MPGTSRAWELIAPHLHGRRVSKSNPAYDNRRFIKAVIWILRTGAPWRDLPPDYGDWKNTHRRFYRCRDKGVWRKLFELFKQEPDFEWFMVDASYIKVHPHATGAFGSNEAMKHTKGGLNTKIHLAVDSFGMPIRILVTKGTVADTQIYDLIDGIQAQYLLADMVYDTNAVIEAIQNAGIEVVIPPKKSRKQQREYRKNIYEFRHIIENTFMNSRVGEELQLVMQRK